MGSDYISSKKDEAAVLAWKSVSWFRSLLVTVHTKAGLIAS
jgi:hypothetical protein